MSSDESDDDFSYTNSAQLLKNIKQKVKTNVAENDNIEITSVHTEDISCRQKRKRGGKATAKKCATLQVDIPEINSVDICDSPAVEIGKINPEQTADIDLCDDTSVVEEKTNLNDSVTLLDDSTDNYSSLLAKVDSYIGRGRGRGRGRVRGRGGRSVLPATDTTDSFPSSRTRNRKKQSMRGTTSATNDVIVIDPDVAILNSRSVVPDELNEEVMIKVLWKSQNVTNFKIRKFQPLKIMFEYFSDREDIPEDRLFFTFVDRVVTMKDTVNSLNLNQASIIEGGVLSRKTHLTSGMMYSDDSIELKVQFRDRKQPLLVNVKVTDEMKILMAQVSEILNVPVRNLRFTFDGERVYPNSSASSLELEGGECIDCDIDSNR